MPRLLSRLAVAGTAVALTVGLTTPAPAATKPATRAQGLQWTALGDSYTAGVIQATGDLTDPRDGCARTTGSYPEIIRRNLGSLVSLRNVSCSGATTANVYATSLSPLGRPLPPFGTDPNAPYPPVPPQIDAVDPATDLITLGIGGNDLGFGEILKSCIELGATHLGQGTPCEDKFDAELPDRLNQLRTDYDRTLTALHAKAPFAKVLTVGYPHLIPEDAGLCGYGNLLQFGTFTTGDLAWARTAIVEPLNAVIAQGTAAHGDTFVDLYPSSAGHSVCDQDHWLDGVLTSIIPLQYALVHPNAEGQAHTATLVEDAVLGG
ncbi:SGNH/GDSL hydrolase family protein [Kitasatospora sp. SUK 42]|uniref:SGNH/GDSL hydrolase family protein n=1 Tax=Kitasatospora sp. SUK 42 TaxID=1588882 RepID=UPI0018C96921|nr:SGNH/GDSL hydrolase family protein [Kitasatospora sp. SUK 42]MBV2151427.1 SGNH/GDSL hydrolase family protein [Kitasatospora sp. SUK 42]